MNTLRIINNQISYLFDCYDRCIQYPCTEVTKCGLLLGKIQKSQQLKLLFLISCDPFGLLFILESDASEIRKEIRLSAFPKFSFQSYSMCYHIQTCHSQILPSCCVLDSQRGSTYSPGLSSWYPRTGHHTFLHIYSFCLQFCVHSLLSSLRWRSMEKSWWISWRVLVILLFHFQ